MALGLLVVPSVAAGLLAVAVAAVFLMRPALNAARNRRDPAERRLARRWTAVWGSLGALALVATMTLGGSRFLGALAAGAPLAVLFAWWDQRGAARTLAAELAGAAAFATVPAAMVLLAGGSAAAAVGWSVVMLVRSGPTVLVVRAAVRMRNGRVGPAAGRWALLAAGGGAVALSGLVVLQRCPGAIAAVAWLLALRAAWLLSPAAAGWSARRIGLSEGGWGALLLGVAAVAA